MRYTDWINAIMQEIISFSYFDTKKYTEWSNIMVVLTAFFHHPLLTMTCIDLVIKKIYIMRFVDGRDL